jgi:hypothetical protein
MIALLPSPPHLSSVSLRWIGESREVLAIVGGAPCKILVCRLISLRRRDIEDRTVIRRIYHISIFAIAAFGVLSLCMQHYIRVLDRPYLPYWDFGEFLSLFNIELPYDVRNITYGHDGSIALLTFESSNATADEFASHFCYGVLIQGYDPFNAEHSLNLQDGHLIMVNSNRYYFSWSPDTPMHHYGNRCRDSQRGGVNQILVEKNDPSSSVVKVQISGSPMNHRYYVDFEGHFIQWDNNLPVINVGIPASPIMGNFTRASEWQFDVEPQQPYEVILQLADQNLLMGDDYLAQMILTPLADFNYRYEYREAYWASNRGRIAGDGLRITFDGSPTGINRLQVFWFSNAAANYSLLVRRLSN